MASPTVGCAYPGCPGHPASTSWRDLQDPHGLLTAEDWADWAAYVAWQDYAEREHGPPDDCNCCLGMRGRHCQHCHPQL